MPEVKETKAEAEARVKAEREALAKAKEAEQAETGKKSDPILDAVLGRLDKLEQSNKRLEADNEKLSKKNKELVGKTEENATLKKRLDDMDRQVKQLNVAEQFTEEQKRDIWKKQRDERLHQIKPSDHDGMHIHTAAGKPLTDASIKADRSKAEA